jgi:hypothetical protein
MTCECGKDPCCCASITGIKGGIHPDAIKTIHMDLTLEEADASQTITHISKVLLNEPCHIVGFDAALVTVKRDIDQANAAKQIQQGVDAGSDYAIRANTPVNVALYTIPSWSPGDLKKGGFGAISQEQDRYYISTASLSAQSPHWTAHEDLFGYFADGSLFVEYNSPSDQYGVRIVVRYVPRLQFSPAYCDPIETMQHYWKCCHGDKEFLEGFYGGTLLAIPSVSSFSAVSASEPPLTSYESLDNPTIGTQLDYSFVGEVPTNLLLDDYGSAAAAYSVRKLRSAYSGSCMRIRESGGNTETDIGFDSNGDLDTAAIAAHCQDSNGYVVTWYDQSGSSNDARQSTTANQPLIYNGTAVLTQNGKPCIQLDGSDDELDFTTTSSTLNHVLVQTNSDSQFIVVSSTTNSSRWNIAGQTSVTSVTISRFDSSPHTDVLGYKNGTLFATNGTTTRGDIATNFGDGNQNLTFWEGFDNVPADTYRIGNYPHSLGWNYAANLQEFIFYSTDHSTNRTGIESNINAYYSIY